MATEHVLDAHTLIWFHAGSPRLGAEARRVLNDPASALVLPAIALAEACWAVGKGRFPGIGAEDILRAVDADPRMTVWPLTRDIVAKTLELPAGMEMHDRQIVATVLVLTEQGRAAALLTQDESIVKSGLVAVVW